MRALRHPIALLTFITLGVLVCAYAAPRPPKILVYNKNQTGKGLYIHDNIGAATTAIKKLSSEHGFLVDVSEDPAVFTSANLKKYKAIVFNNTNNEVLETEEQKTAFQEYIRSGGGFVGIHSASGSMRQWPWFWSLLGGKF